MKPVPIHIILLFAAILVSQVSSQPMNSMPNSVMPMMPQGIGGMVPSPPQMPPIDDRGNIGFTEDGQEGYYGPNGGDGPFPYQGGAGYQDIFIDGGVEAGVGDGYGPGSLANFLEKQRRGISDPFPVAIGPPFQQIWTNYINSLQGGSSSSSPGGPVSSTGVSTLASPPTQPQVLMPPTPVAPSPQPQAPMVHPPPAPVATVHVAPPPPPVPMPPTPVAPSPQPPALMVHPPPAPVAPAPPTAVMTTVPVAPVPIRQAPVPQFHMPQIHFLQLSVAPAPVVPAPVAPPPVPHAPAPQFHIQHAPVPQFHVHHAPVAPAPVAPAPVAPAPVAPAPVPQPPVPQFHMQQFQVVHASTGQHPVAPTHEAPAPRAPAPVSPSHVTSAPAASGSHVHVFQTPMTIPAFINRLMNMPSTAGGRAVSPIYRIVYPYHFHNSVMMPIVSG